MATNNLNNPALTYTLDQFIGMKYSDDITYHNFSIIEKIDDNIELVDHNIIEDYLDELESICVKCELTLEQYRKYKYKPDLLAFDVYGSVQLDFIIMLVNDMIDPKEFDLKTIKLPYASALKAFLSSVYNSEYNYIQQNRAENNMQVI